MPTPPDAVFFDANTVISMGKNPNSIVRTRVADLVDSGIIRVVTTDLTKMEVAKRQVANDFPLLAELGRPYVRDLVHEALGVEIPALTKDDIRKSLHARQMKIVEQLFANWKAVELSIDDVSPMEVMTDYAMSAGVFSGEGKKDQFPDAFILARLRKFTVDGQPLFVVSNDSDFAKACDNEEQLTHLKSVEELFKALNLQIQPPALEEHLYKLNADIVGKLNDEIANFGLIVADVEDGEILSASVVGAEIESITAFTSKDQDEVLIFGRAAMLVEIQFEHPDWDGAYYDSEDKVLIPRGMVSGEAKIEIDADLSMTLQMEEGVPIGVMVLSLLNDRFAYVEILQGENIWE